jgi:hypothetical protein
MKLKRLLAAALGAASLSAIALTAVSFAQDTAAPAANTLKPASGFDSISDKAERSRALFTEAGKVILHPRCVNCHPADDHPRQGMDMHLHQPPVSRGEGGIGMPGMMCGTCHGAANVTVVGQAETIKSIPGHPEWHLAPIEMAWLGKSLKDICEQLKDPERNGGRSLADIVDHMANDSLVGWGWSPGAGREPVPGTQKEFGDLIRYWVDTGAECPTQ